MPYRMMGWAHWRALRALRREDGQGTVEYVGIMLLLATILGVVVKAASSGHFDIADVIVKKVKAGIDKATPGS